MFRGAKIKLLGLILDQTYLLMLTFCLLSKAFEGASRGGILSDTAALIIDPPIILLPQINIPSVVQSSSKSLYCK